MPRFSSRLDWGRAPNALLERLAARRAAGVDVLDLTDSNPTRAGFHYDQDSFLRALAGAGSALYEPAPRGLPIARAAVATYYRDRGVAIDPDSLLLTASTSEAYAFLFKLLCDPGDEVLVPQPGYPLFDFLTALDSVRPIFYTLNYDGAGWRINFERLAAAVGPRTRAVIAVSPHNPTGACLTADELDRLVGLCAERQLPLIVDEVFADYPAGRQSAAAPAAIGNRAVLTFCLNGLSKVVGLPQVKLGWIQVSGPEAAGRESLARLEFIADTYLSVSAAAQHAAPALLAGRTAIQTQIRQRLDDNFAWLGTQGSTRCETLARAGGWYAVLEFHDSLSDDERAGRLLERADVFIHPGYFYDFAREGYGVASLLTPPERFRAGMGRLLAESG